jgi:hypothetical protein
VENSEPFATVTELREVMKILKAMIATLLPLAVAVQSLSADHFGFVAAMGKEMGWEPPAIAPALTPEMLERMNQGLVELEKMFGGDDGAAHGSQSDEGGGDA